MFNSDRDIIRMVAAATLTLLTVSFVPGLARATDNSEEARSVTLQYHITDLNTPEGVANLYRRIRGAAASVCSPLESRLLELKVLWNDCFSHAVANAVQAVHNQKLSAYHWQRIRGWKEPRDDGSSSLAAR
ncbi:MAG: UrcA family protein [Steroidobacteraceae bacterium]